MNLEIKLRIKKAEGCKDLPLPKYHSEDAAAFDLYAAVNEVLKPGEFKMIDTGVMMEIPKGHYGMVVPRSGLA